MMDARTIEASEQMAHAGYPVGRAAALLVELDGSQAECEARFDEVVGICESCGSDDVRVARDEAERALFWKTRKAAFPAMGRISPNYFVQDGVIPRTKLPEVLERIEQLGEEYGLIVANVFHAGDGNLHPLVCYDGRVEGEAEKAEELSGLIIDACLDAGGSITGEHGVGIDKKKHMPKMFAEADLDAFQRLRCAFDPAGLANPGKLMPTPRLCGEVPGPVPGPSLGSGRTGGSVLRPTTVQEAAELLKGFEQPVRPVGGGTKPWLPDRGEAVLETGGLDRILEHNVGDFTAVAGSGRAVRRSAAGLRRARPAARVGPARSGRSDGRRDRGHGRFRPAAPPLRRRA